MNTSLVRKSLFLLAAVAAVPAFAFWTPLQVNLVGKAGLPPAAESVYGLRLNAIYGCCDTVACFDVGLFNRTIEGAYGIRAGVVNWTEGDACGLTVGAFNIDKYNAGVMAGALNYAKEGRGLQVGIINIATDFSGVQVGLLNFHFNSVVPVFPLFNMGSK